MSGASGMSTFMNFGADEALGIVEGLERRHEDMVEIDAVMGVEGTIGDRDFQRRDEGVDRGVALGRRDGRCRGRRVAIHLCAIDTENARANSRGRAPSSSSASSASLREEICFQKTTVVARSPLRTWAPRAWYWR
jgi:hypothetical protein